MCKVVNFFVTMAKMFSAEDTLTFEPCTHESKAVVIYQGLQKLFSLQIR